MEKYPDSLKHYFLNLPALFQPKGMNSTLKIYVGIIFIISLFFSLISIPIGILTFLLSYYFHVRREQKKYGCRYFKNKRTGNIVKPVRWYALSDKKVTISTLKSLLSRKEFDKLIPFFSGNGLEIKNNVYLEIAEEQKSKKYYCLLSRQRTLTKLNDKGSEGLSEVLVVEGKDYKLLLSALSAKEKPPRHLTT